MRKRNVRGKWTYYSDFVVNGRRYQRSLGTGDWREAANKEKELVAKAREGSLPTASSDSLARLAFEKALDFYLADLACERQDRKADPRKSWEGRLTEPLRPFFRAKRLSQISAEDVRAYQASRLAAGKHNHTVNHEVKGLFRLLKRAKLLSGIRDDVKLLPRVKIKREMLTPLEEERLFQAAASRGEWQTPYCAALLTANTTLRPCELKRLAWKDIHPLARTVTVWLSKTDGGTRVVPLNDDAWQAILALRQRAEELGTYSPEHFIFHRLRPIDPTRPVTEWKNSWRSLCKAASKEDKGKNREAMPRLGKLRYYDLRHLAVTKMLEAGVPEGVIREVAGHVDPEMTKLYSHPRLAAKWAAVQALSAVGASGTSGTRTALSRPSSLGGYVTQPVTQALPEAVEVS